MTYLFREEWKLLVKSRGEEIDRRRVIITGDFSFEFQTFITSQEGFKEARTHL
jgi:hypothetical protein